jgi:glucan biosynthesis protein
MDELLIETRNQACIVDDAPDSCVVQVARLATMWDQNLKTRLDAANAQIQALSASNVALEEELAATAEQFSKEKERIVTNYQRLYKKFQEIRSRNSSVCYSSSPLSVDTSWFHGWLHYSLHCCCPLG